VDAVLNLYFVFVDCLLCIAGSEGGIRFAEAGIGAHPRGIIIIVNDHGKCGKRELKKRSLLRFVPRISEFSRKSM
jgi:hypothetical protein